MPKVTAERRDSQISIRIPTSLHDALRREAERDRRSVADVIIFQLERAFAKPKTSKSRTGGK